MSYNYLKDKNGNPISVTTLESQVFDANGNEISGKIAEIVNDIGLLIDDIEYKQEILNMYDHQESKPVSGITLRSNSSQNICLLKDDNGVITSDYGYTYDNLSEILQSGDYSDYIKDGDWFELYTSDGGSYKMYANIDTYYGYGNSHKRIGHHIDFISDNLIYGSSGQKYNSTNINSWRMNYDTSVSEYGSNNGVPTQPSPFLANSEVHRGSEGGIIDKLDDYFFTYIPSELKSHIIKKFHQVPTRYSYSTGKALTDDNGSKWADMSYLWLPYYKEIWGDTTSKYMPTTTQEANMFQYHSFSSIPGFMIKYDKEYSNDTVARWWTASSRSGLEDTFCCVYMDGTAYNNQAHYHRAGAVLCFRFQ